MPLGSGPNQLYANVRPTAARVRIFWTYAALDADRTLVETGKRGRIDEELGLA
jgi:hypothetical protein